MIGQVEIRDGDGGPHLYGVMIQEGRAARRRREVFAPGAVEWPTDGVGILTRHHSTPEARAIPVREPDGRITLKVRATEAIRRAVASGRKYMSVEFHALRERRTEGGIREVLRALVPDVALVASPEYGQTRAEVRQRFGAAFTAFVPTARGLDCKCPSGDCEEIEFGPDAFDGLTEAVATTGTMDQVIGNAALSPGAAGLGIEIDLLDVSATQDVVTLVTAGVGVFARPLIDLDRSETEEGEERRAGRVLRVRKAAFTTILVKPVAGGVRGLDPVELRTDRRRGPSMARRALIAGAA